MARLLRAAVATGLLTEDDDHRYHTTPAGACLRSDVPGSMRNLVIAVAAPGHWRPWGQLYDAIISGQPTAEATLGCGLWDYYDQHHQELKWFARAMSDISNVVSMETVDAYDFSRFGKIVDVGGSQGTMLAAALNAAPAAHGVLFDRPDVIEAGRTTVASYGLDDRLASVGGDFFHNVPASAELYLLKSIVHDWDDTSATKILQTVRAAAEAFEHAAHRRDVDAEHSHPRSNAGDLDGSQHARPVRRARTDRRRVPNAPRQRRMDTRPSDSDTRNGSAPRGNLLMSRTAPSIERD